MRAGEVDADAFHAPGSVGEQELPRLGVAFDVAPRPRPAAERGDHRLVPHPGGHLQQPQRVRLGLLVVEPADEDRVEQGHEPLDVQEVGGDLGRQQHADVPLARVTGEPVHQHPARGHLGQEERLVDPDALAQLLRLLVHRTLGQPRREVEHLDAERLGVGPVLPAHALLGQRQPGHGEHGHPVVPGLRVRVGVALRDQQRHALPELVEEVGHDDRVLVVFAGVPAQGVDHLPRVGVVAPAHRADRAQQHDPGLRHPRHLVGEHTGEHVEHQPTTGGTGQRPLAAPGTLRVVLVEEVFELRLGHHPVRVEDAGLGVEQVDRACVRADLGQLAQLGQRPGRVEDRPVRPRAQGLVDDAAAEERLAAAESGHQRRQARAVPDLLGHPRVPGHRAARGGAGLAEQDAAPVADLGGGRGDGRRGPDHRPTPEVGTGGQCLPGDELPGQRVLRLGMFDRDLRLVEVEHLLRQFQGVPLGGAGHGEPPPRPHPGGQRGEAGGHLVVDLEHPGGLPGQRLRRFQVVFVGVVLDLRAHLVHLPLQFPGDLLGPAHVDAGRPLDGRGQAVGVLHPRVVDLGDLQAVHLPHRQHGDVPGQAGVGARAPAHGDRGRVGLAVHVRRVGEAGQILRLPRRAGHGGQVARRGQPQRARTVHQPGDLLGLHRPALQPR